LLVGSRARTLPDPGVLLLEASAQLVMGKLPRMMILVKVKLLILRVSAMAALSRMMT